MNKKSLKLLKLVVVIAIGCLFAWFLVLSPMIQFHNNEKKLEEAAKRYYELNSDKLPTGERIKTLSLNVLYKQSYLKEDLFIPNTNKVCSLENSWVKVKKVNGEYKYYTYLDCGLMKSSIDHAGPTIKLNGDSEMTVSYGDKFTDPGVSSVVDNSDGKMRAEDVIKKGEVNTNKVGTYEITYTITDSMNNKTVVTRSVTVVKIFKNVIKKDLDGKENYVGNPNNNYVRLSNMLFRIYGLTKDGNVILVSSDDIANVNYSKLEKWLDGYYYNHLNEFTKKNIVKTKFCNMSVSTDKTDIKKCSSYTKKKNIYIPSMVDVNKAMDEYGLNFMKTGTMSWVSTKESTKKAYVTRNFFFGDESSKNYLPYNVNDNYGVRPMFAINGSILIKDGKGTVGDPYTFGDTKKAKGGDLLNTRFTGEYVKSGGKVWRIVDVMEDGTIKVIGVSSIFKDNGDGLKITSMPGDNNLIYNPTNKNNVGYFINNKASKYVDISDFALHEITVPIYEKKIVYGTEKKTKKYKVKLSAPDMYEMFSAYDSGKSYWLINSSNSERRQGAIYDIGVPVNEIIGDYTSYGIRLVGYLKNGTVISSGEGTYESPYILK